MKVLGLYAGVAAPDIQATTLDGKPFKLSDLRGKVVLLDFWATWCAPCVAELPNIRKIHEDFAARGLVVVSISFDRSAEIARKYSDEKSLPWTHVWAEGAEKGPIAEAFGVSAIPSTFVIGPDGKLIDRDLRGDELRGAVERAVAALPR